MAIVFQPDPNLAGYNSLATVAQANLYQESKLNTTWAALPTATKEALLVWASREFSSILWIGSKTVATQNLSWPRSYVPIEGQYGSVEETELYSSLYFDPLVVPTPIVEGVSELAGILAVEDVTADDGSSSMKRVKVDVIELEYKTTASNSWLKKSIRDLIYRYMQNSSPYSAPTRRVG